MSVSKSFHRLLLVLLPYVLLGFFIMVTDPYNLPLALIPIPLFMIGFAAFQTIYVILRSFGIARARCKIVAALSTSIILLIVLLQSIGQLHVRDFLILAILLVGLTFYLRRIDI